MYEFHSLWSNYLNIFADVEMVNEVIDVLQTLLPSYVRIPFLGVGKSREFLQLFRYINAVRTLSKIALFNVTLY